MKTIIACIVAYILVSTAVLAQVNLNGSPVAPIFSTNIPTQPRGTVTWQNNTITSTSPNIVAIEDTSTSTRYEAMHVKYIGNPSGGAATGRKAAFFGHAENTGTQNNTVSMRGGFFQSDHRSTGTIGELTAFDGFAQTFQDAGNATTIIGGRAVASVGGALVVASTVYGLKGQAQLAAGAGGTIPIGVGVRGDVLRTNGGTFTTAYAFQAEHTALTGTTLGVGYFVGEVHGATQYGYYNSDAGAATYSAGPFEHGAFTFATLPTARVGMTAYVSDSNTVVWGATIAGGGANKVLAFYNGTVWTVVAK